MALGIRNGNGRAWLDRWMWEIIRLAAVGVVSLAVAYAGFSREQAGLVRHIHHDCTEIQSIRRNQGAVLVTMLDMFDVLRDRTKADLKPMPLAARSSILAALSRLPDEEGC